MRGALTKRGTVTTRVKSARWILVGVGVLFVINGLVVTSLHLAGPAAYNWQGPTFLILGVMGFATAFWGLRGKRVWPLLLLGLFYLPWTVVGLIGDTGQGYWPLVVGESVGLVVVAASIIILWREAI